MLNILEVHQFASPFSRIFVREKVLTTGGESVVHRLDVHSQIWCRKFVIVLLPLTFIFLAIYKATTQYMCSADDDKLQK